MKNSISMGQIQATGNFPDAVPAKMLGGLNNGNKGIIAKTSAYFLTVKSLSNLKNQISILFDQNLYSHLTYCSNVCQCCK